MTQIQHPSRKLVLSLSAAALILGGCADMNMSKTQRDSAIGAGVGAVAGAMIGGGAKGAVIGGALGGAGGYVWSKHMADKKAAMESATQGTGVAVTQTADNQLKLEIPSDISFDTGRADIKPNLRPILDQFASGLAESAQYRSPHRRPYRQCRLRRGQQPLVPAAGPVGTRLSGVAWRQCRSHDDRRPRRARADCHQRDGRWPRPQPPRRDLPG